MSHTFTHLPKHKYMYVHIHSLCHTHTHTPMKPRNSTTGYLGRKIHLEMFGKKMSTQFDLFFLFFFLTLI